MNNWLGILLCFIYIFAVIGVAEGLRTWRGYSNDFTRKVIHIGVGMISWGLHWIFDNPWYFAVACVAFMLINFLDWRYGFFASMASGDKANLGTVYFPFAVGVVALIFWEQRPLMIAALMPLTWGDGLAPVIGRRYGRRPYTIGGHKRTVEGSLGFLMFGFLATLLALWLAPGMPALTLTAAIVPALVVALAGTVVEGVSIWGVDNLTVTAAAVLILSLWPFG